MMADTTMQTPGIGDRIRAVIFDFGGVLYRTPSTGYIKKVVRFFGVRNTGPISMVMSSPLESPLVMDLMTGRLPEHELWMQLARDLRLHPRIVRFLRGRGFAQQRFDREMADFLAGLRPRFRTAILTNAGSEFRTTFGQIFALENYVDQLIISAEEGIAKPDPRLYELALERMGVRPEEAVFVDDLPENIAGAREVGLNALLHQNTIHTIEAIKKLLA